MEPENIRKFLKKAMYVALIWGLAFLFYFLGWRGVLLTYLVLATLLMIGAILLQSGKGGGLAALGGMGGETLLGTRAATPVAKATMVLGVLFILGSMLLARMPVEKARRGSVIEPEGPDKIEMPLNAPLREGGEEPAPTQEAAPAEQAPPAEGPAEPAPEAPAPEAPPAPKENE
jgi:protein translocase SecG subunit